MISVSAFVIDSFASGSLTWFIWNWAWINNHMHCFPSDMITHCCTKFNNILTHWGRVTHLCVSKLTSIASDNGLSPGWRQAIIWTNAGILLIGPLGTNFSEILGEIHTFSFKKMRLKMSSEKWRPFCPSLNVLNELPLNLENWWIITSHNFMCMSLVPHALDTMLFWLMSVK